MVSGNGENGTRCECSGTDVRNEKRALDCELSFPRKPNPGNAGTITKVLTNFYDVKLNLKDVYYFSVDFDPPIDESEKEVRRHHLYSKFVHDINKYFGKYFYFDNTILYTLKRPSGLKNIEFFYCGRSTSKMTLQFENKVSMTQSAISNMTMQIAHIILRDLLKDIGYVRSAKRYFDEKCSSAIDMDWRKCESVNIWKGYNVSLEMVMRGLVLKIDPTSQVVYKRSMYDLIEDERIRFRGKDISKYITEKFKGFCFITMYNKRVYRITQYIDEKTPDDEFFNEKSGKTMSYANYVIEYYNLQRLRYPRARGMIVHKIAKGRQKGHCLYFIPELCYLTGLSRKMKENTIFSRKLIEATTSSQREKLDLNRRLIDHLTERIARKSEPTLAEKKDLTHIFGDNSPLEISKREVVTSGRVLPMTKVVLKSVRSREFKTVKIIPDLQNKWMEAGYLNYKTHRIKNWFVVYEKSDIRAKTIFMKTAIDTAKYLGVWGKELSEDPGVVEIASNNPNLWSEEIKRICESQIAIKRRVDMFVIILPDYEHTYTLYTTLKYLLSTRLGVLTQCVQVKSLKRSKCHQVVKGMIKQMMAKANNRLWAVCFDGISKSVQKKIKEPTIVVGYDVCHDWKSCKSTVGLCVSSDYEFTEYKSYVYNTRKGKEIVALIGKATKKAVIEYHRRKTVYPKNIFFFRDGVAMSQLSTVMEVEIASIIRCLKEIKDFKAQGLPLGRPNINFVISQKNVSLKVSTPNLRSVRPGTVIDSGVVSREFWDFYLTPHKTPFGSKSKIANPSRFIVLKNEMGFDNNEIQMFTNYLCSVYFNFPGPVKVPAPIKYADRVASLYSNWNDSKLHSAIDKKLFML